MSDFQRYLEAKRTIDDRALNRRVFDRFTEGLASREAPARIVELGAGIGTMIARLAAWDALPERVSYRAVDRDRENVAYAREKLPGWLEQAGFAVEWTDPARPGDRTLVARSTETRLDVSLEVADAFEITDTADAVIAAAFLDVVALEDAIEVIDRLLDSRGLLYAPITFDGGTTFAPAHPLDDRIERCYHRHMDELRAPGGSLTGRELLVSLPDRGWTIEAAGGADWVVRPIDDGYPDGERAFVDHILETIDEAIAELDPHDLSTAERERWLDRRRGELDRGELVYVAHNLDVLARPPQR